MSAVLEARECAACPDARQAPLALHFDLLATASGGVRRLRELIFTIAVRGKLAQQHPGDEPAIAALERVRSRRDQLVAQGCIKRVNSEASPPVRDVPYDLPVGWEWVRASDLCVVITDGDHQAPPKAGSGVPFLVIGDVRDGSVRLEAAERFVPNEYFDGLDWAKKPLLGDVLYTTVGSLGIPVPIVRQESFCFQRHIALFRPGITEFQGFLTLALRSRLAFDQAEQGATGIAQKTVSLSVLRNMLLPLPPLAEQHRIVARVEELMRLCDALEESGHLADEQHARLTSTLFDALGASESAHALAENWRRVAEHFDLLLDRPYALDALEHTVRRLAVRGLLVSQQMEDEAASELVTRIIATRTQIRPSSVASIAPNEISWTIPPSWKWVRLRQIADTRLGKMLDKAKNRGSEYPYLRNTNVQWQRFQLDDVKTLRLESHEVDEYRLKVGDLLICEGGEPGRCAIWKDASREMYFQKALHRVRPLGGVLPEYLELHLRQDADSGRLSRYFTGATIKHFAGQELARYVVALPPIAEQARIVARVEELRRLCADLRQRLTQAREAQSRLADAMVAEVI